MGGKDDLVDYFKENQELIGWEGLKHFKPTERKGNGYYLNKNGCQYYTERICENWCFFSTNY